MEIVKDRNNEVNIEVPSLVTGFKIGNDHYCISVLDVQEVIRPQQITPIPKAAKHIRGLINLRGQIVTSISLRSLFGLDEHYDDHMNVIVRHQNSLFALVVDEILDVIDVENESFSTTPENMDSELKKFSKGVFKFSDNLMILLDLNKILETP